MAEKLYLDRFQSNHFAQKFYRRQIRDMNHLEMQLDFPATTTKTSFNIKDAGLWHKKKTDYQAWKFRLCK